MNVQLQGNEQITKLFNDWYLAMLKQDVSQATNLKHEIEEKELNFEEDENLALCSSWLTDLDPDSPPIFNLFSILNESLSLKGCQCLQMHTRADGHMDF